MSFSSYVILTLTVLVSVPFVTLLEQKMISSMQVRIGPSYVGYVGLLQPFADAVKLFFKETTNLKTFTFSVFQISPFIILTMSLLMWTSTPLKYIPYKFSLSTLFFICLSSMMVYPLLSMGWSSNSKYPMLGSLRATAQMMSYEVSLFMILISLVWTSQSLNISFLNSQTYLPNASLFLPLALIWFACTLAETNRTPYDFTEGESELVSGFNTEYSAEGFTLIFISEYASIMFMSALLSLLFMSYTPSILLPLKTLFILSLIIWVRVVLPRYRYDKLMYLAWKKFLPLSILFFTTFFFLTCL